MDKIAYLAELVQSNHRVTVHPDGDTFVVEVYRTRNNPDEQKHYYIGPDLGCLFQRAWAGEPGERR